MRLGTITRDPAPMNNIHTYQPKRLRWRWHRCLPLVALATVAVVAVIAIMGVMWLG